MRRIAAWFTAVQKAARVRALIIARQMAVAAQKIFVGRQALQAHRAAGVQPAGADADLGAEAIAIAVGKARGGVMVHARGIHLLQKDARGGGVVGDDGVGVGGAETLDVVDGFVHAANDFQGQDQVAVFGVPLVVADRLDGDARECAATA